MSLPYWVQVEDASFVFGVVIAINAIGRAGQKKEMGLLRPGLCGPKPKGKGASAPNGTVMYRALSTKNGDTDNEDNSSFAGFFNLTKMLCSVLS